MDTDPEPDLTPPTIVSLSPDDRETGVPADTVIRITFSEPMDQVATELAYVSQDIPYADVEPSWSADGTVLTLTPGTPLLYGEGPDVDESSPDAAAAAIANIDALEYSVGIAEGGRDLAGNRLESKLWSFKTLRRITQAVRADPTRIRGAVAEMNRSCVVDGSVRIGDTDSGRTVVAFVEFDMDLLAPNVAAFEGALFYAGDRLGTTGTPEVLGGVTVQEFEADILTATVSTPAGAKLADLPMTGNPNAELMGITTSSYEEDGLLQLRLGTVIPEDNENPAGNDFWSLDCSSTITFTYLAP